MKAKNKIEIDLSVEDIKQMLYDNLRKTYGEKEYSFDFKVVNKPYRCGYFDTCDNHVFDGVKIVITKGLENK